MVLFPRIPVAVRVAVIIVVVAVLFVVLWKLGLTAPPHVPVK